MTLNTSESIVIIAIVAALTFLTRVFPFILFGGNKKAHAIVEYLGKILPSAIIATLIIYCLRNVNFLNFPSGIAEIISIAVVAILHLWKRNNLLSIGVGTIFYMALVQYLTSS
jgi:branched-subunit amino acid transport protein AzlD